MNNVYSHLDYECKVTKNFFQLYHKYTFLNAFITRF